LAIGNLQWEAIVLRPVIAKDILGTAISDYYFNREPARLWVYDTIGPRVEMEVGIYFRDWAHMPALEQIALQECRGRILDIGAGAGSHVLELQRRRKNVTALEISPGAVAVMEARGVRKVIAADIFNYSEGGYDTLLLLMNGIGLVGDTSGLRRFLAHAGSLLNGGGQLIFDSSDVSYLYEDLPFPEDHYFGQITCRYGYKRRKTAPFSWLYIDFETLKGISEGEGWRTELLFEDGHDQYLVRLSRKD
jgi:SAM-dependent methyltransferase